MALTDEATALTEAHRLAQARIGEEVIRHSLRVWPVLDLADLPGTLGPWLDSLVPFVVSAHERSTALAGTYLVRHRALEVGADGEYRPVPAGPVDQAEAGVRWSVEGPRRYPAARRRVTDTVARQQSMVEVAREASLQATTGGSDTIMRSAAADPLALGWARVTSFDPCAFCAMLASRGPVYGSKKSAAFQAHKGCNCRPEPVYHRSAPWPGGARPHEWRDLWNRSTKGQSGKDALNAFRRAYRAR